MGGGTKTGWEEQRLGLGWQAAGDPEVYGDMRRLRTAGGLNAGGLGMGLNDLAEDRRMWEDRRMMMLCLERWQRSVGEDGGVGGMCLED